jgi:hypothetical protein
MPISFSSLSRLLIFFAIASLAAGEIQRTGNRTPGRPGPTTQSQPVDPNNILVSVNNSVREYTPNGTLVQTIQFDYGGRPYPWCCPSNEYLHGIVVDQYGWIDSFNGTWYPLMTRYSPDSNGFVVKTFPDWSAGNVTYLGTIAAAQNFVFAADYSSFAGIVRFDTFNDTAARFATNLHFIGVNFGLDGKLYALSSSNADIYVYDPATMQLLNHVTKASNVAWIYGVAADRAGHIYVTGNDGSVSRLNSAGVREATIATGLLGLTNIDVDETGRLIVAQSQGQVLIGDTTLSNNFASFTVGDPSSTSSTFVSFAHAVPLPIGPVATPTPTPVPTPTPPATRNVLLALGSVVAGTGNREQNTIREFSPDGTLLRKIRLNYNGGIYPGTEYLRSITVSPDNAINAYNGTFAPFLTRFFSDCSTLTHTTYPGWSTVNAPLLGGIGSYQNFIFATDMYTVGGQPNGIVRFDTSNNTATRFANNADFYHLNVGLDGKVYAAPASGGFNIYDPTTLLLLNHLNLPSGVFGAKFAVDQNGKIFLTSSYGTVYRLNTSGQVEASVATGFPHLTSIQVDTTGRLIMSTDDGYVVTGQSTLTSFSHFSAINDGNTWTTSIAFSPSAPAPPVGLLDVISRKTHGSAGTFDIDLQGSAPIECRTGGVNGDYTMIFSFAHDLVGIGAACCIGGTVSSSMIDPNNPSQFIVNITGVTNGTYVTVTLDGVDGSGGTHNDYFYQQMGVLVGDVNSDGVVNVGDTVATKSQSGNPVTTSNARADVNTDGLINVGDIVLVKNASGTALPPQP